MVTNLIVGSNRDFPDQASLGHAISSDLRNWKELPVAILPGEQGQYDDGHIFTGCALRNDNQIYLYYSSNHFDGERTISGMCLATSTDGINFEKHVENPIIEPDPDLYISKNTPLPDLKYHNWPDVDCRDISIIPDPSGSGWLGYVVMRMKDKDRMNSCCIVLCKSLDLVNWQVLEPCCSTDRFICFEVPDVFQLNGRWYMLALTGNIYGQRARWSDISIGHGTIVFEADTPYGPFKEIKDNLLLASNDFQGFSVRTLEFDNKRLMLYTRAEGGIDSGGSNYGALSWPVELIADSKKGLIPKFWKENEGTFRNQSFSKDALIKAEKKWVLSAISDFGKQPKEFILSCRIKIEGSAAGISFNREDSLKNIDYNEGLLLILDLKNGEIQLLSIPQFHIKQRRKINLKTNVFDLRLVVIKDFVEVYLNDVLFLNCFSPGKNKSPIMLFCEDADSYFSDIKLLSN